MILPIMAYGHPVLRKKAADITPDYPDLKEFIANMYETMENARGVGLAAPQVGKSIRLFLVDASAFAEDPENESEKEELKKFKHVFINPQIIEEEGEEWAFAEGCLSIPDIHENVNRQPNVTMTWLDENFKEHKATFSGIRARIIQHEYDHIEGVLFIDHINPFRRNLLKGKLANISKGKSSASYRMKVYTKKGRR